jgi:hypothetical protein
MHSINKYFKYSLPFTLAILAFGTSPANAALKNVALSIDLNTEETLGLPVQPDGTACPAGAVFAGTTKGTGNISIGSGRRIYKGPASALATDCATATMQFSNGKLTLIAAVNGNTLTATYYGSFIPSPTVENPYLHKISNGAFAITGGTGYFGGATGTGNLAGTVTVPPDILANPMQIIKGTLKAVGRISFSTEAFEQAYGIEQ